MIEVNDVTKRYGETVAVDRLSFVVKPGIVTGFLGPNGAGKSTTMRMILGLDTPTSGSITVNGRPYRESPAPMREVGALLDAKAIQGNRTARQHLRWLAQAGGIPTSRVDEVLHLVGLTDVAGRKVGGFSLGMSQRLGIAGALLGDPGVLLFDEPVNGLDMDGVLWVRRLVRTLADEGRTGVVSSHLMSEMQLVADRLVVVAGGRLVADAPLSELVAAWTRSRVVVRTPDPGVLAERLRRDGAGVEAADGGLVVHGTTAEAVGDAAHR